MAFQFNQGDRPLPGYTIHRGVGRGGFGEVYYATSDGGKEVALKFLRENPQVELRGVTHCLNLKSPYLVAIHDVKQNADGDFFVIMEYVNGPTLRDLMNTAPNGLGPQKAAYFLREIGKGLAYLHDRGIVHRDLKPGNIFYEDGYVKIGDYGLAKIMAASQHSGQTVSVGTVHYMAPEVGQGNYDRTIDIYALGVMLYEMLLGRVPYTGSSMGEVLMKHLTAQPEVDELPAPYPAVIRKALAKDPSDRYQTINEMVSELFEVEDLNRSVAAFEPATLSVMAARAAKQAHVAIGAGVPAVPIGGPAVGPFGTGSSNVGQHVPPPVIDPAAAGADRMGGLPRPGGRLGARMEAISNRIDRSPVGQRLAHAGRGHWAEKLLMAFIVSAGMSVAVAVTTVRGGTAPGAIAVFLHMTSVVAGALFGTILCAGRLKVANKWVQRFVIMAIGGAGLMIGAFFSDGMLKVSRTDDWAVVLAASLLLCDWPGRFRAGQRGEVSLGSAFSVGLFGLIAGAITSNSQAVTIGAICAASSLVLQSLAGLWPTAARAAVAGAAGFCGRMGAADETLAAGATPAVAVSPGSLQRPVILPAHNQGLTATAPEHPHVEAALERSPAARAIWTVVAVLLLATTALIFIAGGLKLGGEFDYWIVGGIVASQAFLFSLSCAVPRVKCGLWRGVFRKAVFFGGIALSGACGASIGLFSLQDEDLFTALVFVIVGGLMSIGVWFIPVPAYAPRPPKVSDEEEEPRRRSARVFKILGLSFLGLALALLPILLIAVHHNNQDEVLPAVLIPMSVLGVSFAALGFSRGRRPKPGKPKLPKLKLPLKRVFECDGVSNLGGLIERHMTMLGYSLDRDGSSDMLWSFVRGNWAAHFWQEDIRQWKTKVNIAAYELSTGGFRVTAFLNVDAPFNDPRRKAVNSLDDELGELVDLLGGRELSRETQEVEA